MSKVKTFINIGGSHFERDPNTKETKEYKKGSIVKSTRDLHKAFPEKFRLQEEAPQEEKTAKEDVTDQFELAADNDLKVFKEGKEYTVEEEGEVISEGKITTKKAVNTFLEEYTAEEE